MLKITGIEKFKEFFELYKTNYVLIGGSACAIIFDEIGLEFRATKDLDVVLIVENINSEFGKAFWSFVKAAGYTIEWNSDKKNFYRFTKPENSEYPQMIELFSRKNTLEIPADTHLIPVHVSDDVSSLSAILLNDDYYHFMLDGMRVVDGISVLDEKYLIPFKVKAWCELIDRREAGEKGQSKHIKKHCRDVYRLISLLVPDEKVELKGMVQNDMNRFLNEVGTSEYVPDDIDRNILRDVLIETYIS